MQKRLWIRSGRNSCSRRLDWPRRACGGVRVNAGSVSCRSHRSRRNRNAKSAGTWAERGCLLALRENEGRCRQEVVLVVEDEVLVAEDLGDFFIVASGLPSSRQVINGTSQPTYPDLFMACDHPLFAQARYFLAHLQHSDRVRRTKFVLRHRSSCGGSLHCPCSTLS